MLKALRRNKSVRELMLDGETNFYQRKGARQFASDWTSTVEETVMQREAIDAACNL